MLDPNSQKSIAYLSKSVNLDLASRLKSVPGNSSKCILNLKCKIRQEKKLWLCMFVLTTRRPNINILLVILFESGDVFAFALSLMLIKRHFNDIAGINELTNVHSTKKGSGKIIALWLFHIIFCSVFTLTRLLYIIRIHLNFMK